MDLGTILNSVEGYHTVLEQFGFKLNGTGNRPWSHRGEDPKGSVIEFNANGWDLYLDGMCYTGRNHKDLKAKLLEGYSREELIKMLTEQ